MLVDTHAHLYNENYKNVNKIIKNSKANGIYKIINCADNMNTSKEVIKLSKEYKDFLYSAIGIHPHFANNFNKLDIIELEKMINNKEVIAIGEIGLDFFYDYDKKKQIDLFERQLNLAQKNNLPVIIHSRNSNKEIINIIKKYKIKGIIHCFNGSLKEAKKFIKLGYLIGIGGIVTFKNSGLKEIIKNIDIEYIVLETDSPYLTPEPYRKYKNEPKYIVETAKKISDIKSINYGDIIKITYNNINRIFDL